MATRRLGKFSIKNSALFLCDMQEKFRGNIAYYPQIITVANRMLQAAEALEMPVFVTEQYPKGKRGRIKIHFENKVEGQYFATCPTYLHDYVSILSSKLVRYFTCLDSVNLVRLARLYMHAHGKGGG